MITIITPSYNAEDFLLNLYLNIKDILSDEIQWIIVDDCSQDKTKDIYQTHLACNQHIQYIQLTENSGPSNARRYGVEKAKTEFIFLFDVDDVLLCKQFVEFCKYVKNNDGFDYYYAPSNLTRKKSGEHINLEPEIEKQKIYTIKKPTDFIKYGFPNQSSLAFRRDFYLEKLVVNRLSWGEDIVTYLDMAKSGIGIRWSTPVSCYVIHGNGRGSELCLVHRVEMCLALYKTSFKKNSIISSLLFSTYMTSRTLVSFLYKKTRALFN